mgnify:CR=1 FL=1
MAPWIPGYYKSRNVKFDDICYFGSGGCLTLGLLAEIIDPLPGDSIVVTVGCEGAVGAGCFLKDTVQRYTSCNRPALWVYKKSWWNFAPTPNPLLIPHC